MKIFGRIMLMSIFVWSGVPITTVVSCSLTNILDLIKYSLGLPFEPKMTVSTLTFIVLTLCGLSRASGADCAPKVETKLGTIIGTVKEVNVFGKQMKVERYHGIPYAEPPVGKLRFQYPVPKAPFTSPYEATEHGNLCYQLNMFPLEGAVYSEDCLFLNIYAPVVRSKPTPVMVWIHGGGFSTGSSNFYITDTLSAFGEVVVVTINYRLTLFGFLSTGDENAPGNVGLMDQHLAIKWVNENIEAFGGDPEKVTIFGESAGGMSVAYQSLFPENEGLFQRAIAQSGSLWWTPIVGPQNDAERLGKLVGCEQQESLSLIECLQGVPGDLLDTTLNNFTNGLFAPPVPFLPSIDGKFLREAPRDTFEKSDKARDFFGSLDFMSGNCAEEGIIMMLPITGVPDPENFQPDLATFRDEFVPNALSLLFRTAGAVPDIVKQVVAHEYTDWNEPNNLDAIRKKSVQLLSDMVFTSPMLQSLSGHASLAKESKNTYMYVFSVIPSRHVLPTPSWFNNATHGDEFAYEFFEEDGGVVSLMPGLKDYKPEEWERDVAQYFMTLWSNFAKTGNPNEPKPVKINWPPYTTEKQQYLDISREMTSESVKSHLLPREDNLWRNIVPSLAQLKDKSQSTVQSDEQTTGYCEKDGGCEP